MHATPRSVSNTDSPRFPTRMTGTTATEPVVCPALHRGQARAMLAASRIRERAVGTQCLETVSAVFGQRKRCGQEVAGADRLTLAQFVEEWRTNVAGQPEGQHHTGSRITSAVRTSFRSWAITTCPK